MAQYTVDMKREGRKRRRVKIREQAEDRSKARADDSPIWNNSPACAALINLLLATSPPPLGKHIYTVNTHTHTHTHTLVNASQVFFFM